MKDKAFKAIKVAVPIATLALSAVSAWLSDKNLDEKIAQKTAEALAKTGKEEA